jgi:curli biogenesis system outer membrane secretion channel CsgG
MHDHPIPMTLRGITAFACLGALSFSSAWAQTGSGGKDGAIEKCERNLGTLAVSEPQSHMLSSLGQYKLGSPSTMLRMIAQESACFTVVERGVGMQNIQQERALASGGMLQQDSNIGGGQLQAADFVLTPSLQFSDSTGGLGGAVGGLLGRMGGTLGALGGLVGGLKFKEAETTLLLADVRSGIQVASAEGQASKMDFSLGGWGWGGFGWAAAGGYSKTPEGKLLAASLLDNFNRIVQQVRNKPSLVPASSASSRANAQASTRATPLAPVTAPAHSLTPAPTLVSGADSTSDVQFLKVAGVYGGQLNGLLTGPLTMHVTSDGGLYGTVNLPNQPVLTLGGQMNNAQGDFMLSGNHQTGAIMVMGRLNPSNFTMNGNWFISQSTSAPPSPGGRFEAKR